MGQVVLADRTRISPDGKSLIMTIRDVETGKVREFDNDDSLFSTGPGKEKLRGVDTLTQRFYEEAERDVEALIERVTRLKADGRPIRPTLLTEGLPQILSLTMIEKLYRLWDDVLDREDKYWPFRNLVKEGVEVGITASGDSGRTVAEFVGQNGPKEGYPSDLDRDQTPDVVLYNVAARNRARYVDSVRNRYKYVYTSKTTANPEKIIAVRYLDNGKLRVFDELNFGKRLDYVILATGFERDPIEDQLAKGGIETKKLRDAQGNVVGRGNLGVGVMIGGSALGFKKEDFPQELQNIIDVLAVGENTLSLWVYNILLSRLLWTNGKVSQAKVETLLNDIRFSDSATRFRNEITKAIQGDTPKPVETRTRRKIRQMAIDLAKSAGLKVDEQALN